jgi:hypothetical protein
MFDQSNGEWQDVTFRHQVRRAFDGTAVIEGCGVTLGSSGSDVEFLIQAGAVQFDGNRVEVGSQTAIADPGESEERYDAVVLGESGEAYVLKGDPGDTVPPSTAGQSVVVLAVVRIPPDAGGTGDLSSTDISDRRLPVIVGATSSSRDTIRLPSTAIEPDGSVAKPIFAQPGQILEMYKWGVTHVDDGLPQNAPSGVQVQLINPSGEVIQSESSMLDAGEPLFDVEITGSDVQIYQIRLKNDSEVFFRDPEGLAASAEIALLD